MRRKDRKKWETETLTRIGEALRKLPEERQEAFDDVLAAPILTAGTLLMMDSDIFVKLAGETSSFLLALRTAIQEDRLGLFITRKQAADELARIPDKERREALQVMMIATGEEDGQLLNVAWNEGAILVTNDGRLKSRAWLLDMKVWDYARFRSEVAR